jgi:hypothetical protein
MGKVTSADCKKWIVENCSTDTNVKDWKRKHKYKQGDATVRVFDNDVAGESVGIVERDGEIVGAQEESGHIPDAPKKDEVEVLYAIVESEDEPGYFGFSFTTVEDWEEHKCQTDSMIDDVGELMSSIGLFEDIENFYLVEPGKLELVKELLVEDPRFGTRDDFSKFMESCEQDER